jgi:hypothetical protein
MVLSLNGLNNLKRNKMTILHLAVLIIIIAPLWIIVDTLKDILKELKKK